MPTFIEMSEVKALIEKRIASKLADYDRELERIRKRIAETSAAVRKKTYIAVQTAENLLQCEVFTKEQALRYVDVGYCWDFNPIVSADKLPKLFKRFGTCKVTDEYQELSAEERTIKVKLDLGEKYFGPDLYVARTISADANCQYETIVQTEKKLVCRKPKK